jgi:hypothetical protein
MNIKEVGNYIVLGTGLTAFLGAAGTLFAGLAIQQVQVISAGGIAVASVFASMLLYGIVYECYQRCINKN